MDALFSSPRCGLPGGASCCSNWGWTRSLAACPLGGRVWMVDPPETRWAGGWGTPPSRPSNQARPGGTRGGSARPYWLAVNKSGPTPCKHAMKLLLVAVRPSLVNPGARRPHSNLPHPHWTPGPPDENPLSPRPPGGPATRGRPPDNQTAQRPPAPIFEAVLARLADRPRSDLLPPPQPASKPHRQLQHLHLAF